MGRLNATLDAHGFDEFVEAQCTSFYATKGRPSLTPGPPEHSTISRRRRLIDVETHRAVFSWILQVLATADLVKTVTTAAEELDAVGTVTDDHTARDAVYANRRPIRGRRGRARHRVLRSRPASDRARGLRALRQHVTGSSSSVCIIPEPSMRTGADARDR